MSKGIIGTATYVEDLQRDQWGEFQVWKIDPPFEGLDYLVTSTVSIADVPGLADEAATVVYPYEYGKGVATHGSIGTIQVADHEVALLSVGYKVIAAEVCSETGEDHEWYEYSNFKGDKERLCENCMLEEVVDE